MKIIIYFFLLLNIQSVLGQKFVFQFEGSKRKYVVHLPAGYSESKHYPIVLNFHGLLANTTQQRKYSRMNETADRHGFIVVYPYGKGHFWNTGIGKKSYFHSRNDVGFVNEMLNRLIKDFNIDTTRIYSCGLSLGGYFSYRLACELNNRIAAIASVGGVTSDSTAKYCTDNRKVPVLQIHGTKDPIVKYGGFKRSMGAEETVNYWIQKNKCTSHSDTTAIPDECTKDKTTAKLMRFTGKGREQVWFVKIDNGGHTWPGTRIDYLFLGKTNMDFKASELIWEFFSQFQLIQP